MNDKTKNRRECYGTLLPDFEHLNYNQATEGRAFRIFVEKVGAGKQARSQELKLEAWEDCVVCPDFHPCYELSMAKLAVHRALEQC